MGREYVTGETPGYVYIVCLDRPIGNPGNRRGQAKHYLGWTLDLARRADRAGRSGSGDRVRDLCLPRLSER